MQEHPSLDNPTETAARSAAVGRHRATGKSANRGPYLSVAAILVVGFGLAGVSAATADGDPGQIAESAVVASDMQARAEVAERADRADRGAADSSAPSAEPSASAEPTESVGATATAEETPPAEETPAAEPNASSAAPTTPPAPKPDWVHPMPGARVTSCFGPRWGVLHAGIDLAKPANTPVYAAGAGRVTAAGWVYSGYGISVMIDHGNGYLTHYAHLNEATVNVGDRVAAGDLIGREGSTGDSTGPHLHFEVHNGLWNQLNPAPWMRDRGVNLGC